MNGCQTRLSYLRTKEKSVKQSRSEDHAKTFYKKASRLFIRSDATPFILVVPKKHKNRRKYVILIILFTLINLQIKVFNIELRVFILLLHII